MPQSAGSEDSENARIVLGLLESVERDGAQSQRKLASDLGIALGLIGVSDLAEIATICALEHRYRGRGGQSTRCPAVLMRSSSLTFRPPVSR
jgi:hypothetical protein